MGKERRRQQQQEVCLSAQGTARTDFLAISTGPARATREAAILDGMAML